MTDEAFIERVAQICDDHDSSKGRMVGGEYAGRSVFVAALRHCGWNDAAIRLEVDRRWPTRALGNQPRVRELIERSTEGPFRQFGEWLAKQRSAVVPDPREQEYLTAPKEPKAMVEGEERRATAEFPVTLVLSDGRRIDVDPLSAYMNDSDMWVSAMDHYVKGPKILVAVEVTILGLPVTFERHEAIGEGETLTLFKENEVLVS